MQHVFITVDQSFIDKLLYCWSCPFRHVFINIIVYHWILKPCYSVRELVYYLCQFFNTLNHYIEFFTFLFGHFVSLLWRLPIFFNFKMRWCYSIAQPLHMCLTFNDMIINTNPDIVQLQSKNGKMRFSYVCRINIETGCLLGDIVTLYCVAGGSITAYTLIIR